MLWNHSQWGSQFVLYFLVLVKCIDEKFHCSGPKAKPFNIVVESIALEFNSLAIKCQSHYFLDKLLG